ncbi:reverse transcriptase [Plakobranchus ocellatus]|uniref:Reverse transcriptase n=1 Tax=Plakobranchus ocellatus TaxID=259542 RepID=A0AAV4C5V8_9GAST|nr:reverse transcriptase [Plakobranchus ocellatus]
MGCTISPILFVLAMEVIFRVAEGGASLADLGGGCYMPPLKAFRRHYENVIQGVRDKLTSEPALGVADDLRVLRSPCGLAIHQNNPNDCLADTLIRYNQPWFGHRKSFNKSSVWERNYESLPTMLCKPLLMFRAIELLCNVSQPWCKEEEAIQEIERLYRGFYQAKDPAKFYHQVFSAPQWDLCFHGSWLIRVNDFKIGKTNCKHVPDGRFYRIRRVQCPPDPEEGYFKLCKALLYFEPLGRVHNHQLDCYDEVRKPYSKAKSYDIYFLQRDQEYLHTTLCKPHSMFPTLVLLCNRSEPLCLEEKVLQQRGRSGRAMGGIVQISQARGHRHHPVSQSQQRKEPPAMDEEAEE